MCFCFTGGIIPVSSLLEQRMVIHIPTPIYMGTVDRGSLLLPLHPLLPYLSPLAVAATTSVEQAPRFLLDLGSPHYILQTPLPL
jgi:hypothetical protein